MANFKFLKKFHLKNLQVKNAQIINFITEFIQFLACLKDLNFNFKVILLQFNTE